MQQKKHFQTQRVSRWKLLDRLSWIIPVLFLIYLVSFNGGLGAYFSESLAAGDIPASIAIAVFLIFTSCFLSLPPMLIWRAVTRYLRNNALKNATFYAHEGLDYYREKLSGLSPTMISMLIDLEIETSKDAAALILKYSLLNVVSLNANEITITNPSHPSLTQSDHLLLEQISKKALRPDDLFRWKVCAADETIQEGQARGYFKQAKTTQQSSSRGCAGGCLGAIVLFFLVTGVSLFILDLDKIDAYLAGAPVDLITPYQQITYLIADPHMSVQLFIMLILGLLLFVAFALPIVGLIRTIVISTRPIPKVVRTEKGEHLTEQIAGMKNFIHDFSNLSQAEKGALVVWDDFLIYAVVLEENEAIVQEILGQGNINYDQIKRNFSA